MSRIYDTDIIGAVKTLREGGVIVYPTDTVWGIGCDATNPAAVDKVYKLKQRSDRKALITLIDSVEALNRYVPDAPQVALDLASITNAPLTIIYDDVCGLAHNLIAEDGSAAIRIPLDKFCHDLCKSFGRPIVSTSANISGESTPGCFAEISEEIKRGADYVCTTRREDTTRHNPSGIIKISTNGVFRIIR